MRLHLNIRLGVLFFFCLHDTFQRVSCTHHYYLCVCKCEPGNCTHHSTYVLIYTSILTVQLEGSWPPPKVEETHTFVHFHISKHFPPPLYE